jgi:2-phospho-L-lactate guanylyltransferase
MLAAVIFVKRLAAAKSRLGNTLSPLDRLTLTRRMLLQVVDAAIGTTEVDDVVVVSPEPAIAATLNGRNVRVLLEQQPRGLNEAARFASAMLAAAGTSRALLLPADLPRMNAEHIEGLIKARSRSGLDTIVPSLDGSGTNALLIDLPPRFPLAFGSDSFNRHLANAANLKQPLAVHRCFFIGFDVDHPDDVQDLGCELLA